MPLYMANTSRKKGLVEDMRYKIRMQKQKGFNLQYHCNLSILASLSRKNVSDLAICIS